MPMTGVKQAATLHLRLAVDTDADAISALIASHSPVAPGTPGWAPFFHSISAAGIRERLAQPEYCFVVALDEGALAGVIAMRAFEHLAFFFVQRHCHGKGIGRQLWDKMQALAWQAGSAGPFFVNADPRAVLFYERLGFVVSGEPRLSLGIACIPMTREK